MARSTIVLPETQGSSLEEFWIERGHHPHPQGSGRWIEVTGLDRRLAAGLRSIRSRGFSDLSIGLDPIRRRGGWHGFRWESSGGLWGRRAWRVSARVRLTPEGVEARRVRVSVQSPSSAEWTTWEGGPLARVISDRLTWVVGVVGARVAEPTDHLSEVEVEQYHDLHPSPVAAWADASGRVVLVDDDWGAGFLRVTGDAAQILSNLREQGWRHLLRKE